MIGVNVWAGPRAPSYSPAMTRTLPPPASATLGNWLGLERLVRRRRGLVLARQVHPELHHVHAPAAARELLLVVLLVEDAGAAVIHCASPGPMTPA